MPVTRIETWVRDPYAVYAREILRLRPLDRPDAPLAAHHRGTAIHRAFQLFAERDARPAELEPSEHFAALVLEALDAAGFSSETLVREALLARRLGVFAADFERERRPRCDTLLLETEGELTLQVDGRPFTVTAKADRIEVSGDDASILDFKTGQAPTAEQVKTGFSPQLPLTAAILLHGGFADLGPHRPRELLFVRAIGRRVAGEVIAAVKAPDDAQTLAQAALEGLKRRVARFDDAETPYRPWAAPQFLAKRAGDYDHLSRLYEWHVVGDGGEGVEG
jgi:ATP-dependent helicase/nuclease subunit B